MLRAALILLMLGIGFQTANSQVLISLLLGDKLNSPNLEFGLEGGLNWSNIKGGEDFSTATDFHLGFYFDFRLNRLNGSNNWQTRTAIMDIS